MNTHPSRSRHLFALTLALVGLMSAMAKPGFSRNQAAPSGLTTKTDSAKLKRSPGPRVPLVAPLVSKSILIYGPSLDPNAIPNEQSLAQAAGYTVTVVDEATWAAMTAEQFATFDAIVFGDPSCGEGPGLLATADATKSVWSRAITGPVYVQGSDPVFHAADSELPGTQILITDGINFAASGPGTGVYVSLSCYYEDGSSDTSVDFLSSIGDFKVSAAGCLDTVTIVNPTHPAMVGLTDGSLSNWGCSVHEFVTSFPSNFIVLATAVRPTDEASLPYIIASVAGAATPTPTPTATPTATPTPTPTPAAGSSWSVTGNLNTARSFHSATRLPNGKVLVAGGAGSSGSLNNAELYDPATGVWSNTGNLNTARDSHTATLLPNGKVLVAAGFSCAPPPQSCSALNSAELYDPDTGTWSSTGNLNTARDSHTATLLPNGKVLVAGGFLAGTALDNAEFYDPASGVWGNTGSLNTGRYRDTATLLPDGKVLVAGGLGASADLNSAEIYDPASGLWSNTGNLNTARELYTATLLPNGKVLVAGGFIDFDLGLTTNSAELYDPSTGIWSITGDLNTGRSYHTATLIRSGEVLIAGGFVDFMNRDIKSAELYDPFTGTWTNTAALNSGRRFHTGTLLSNGKVLVATGSLGGNTAELYDSGANPTSIDDAQFFVRQHYLDFLNREPDAKGLTFWTNEITQCSTNQQCLEVKRINVSAAFFLSIEFQQTGYLVYRIYKTSYGNLPGAPVPLTRSEFLPDTQEIGQGVIVNQPGWETALENNKQAFMLEFVQRSRFTSAYPTSMTPDMFVDTLFANAGVVPSSGDRADAINEFSSATTTADTAARARALRRVAENSTLAQQEFNRAFVLMQYFGYLRRNPNDPPEPTLDFTGYNFWLNKLNQFNGNVINAEMVKAFLVSTEYRQRFGQP